MKKSRKTVVEIAFAAAALLFVPLYNRCIQPHFMSRRSLLHEARLAARQHRLDDALFYYGCRIEQDKSDAAAYSERGQIHQYRMEHRKAVDDFTAALHFDPNHARIYIDRGLEYHHLHRNDAAIVDYTSAIRIDPTDPRGYFHRAVAYDVLAMQNGKTDSRPQSVFARLAAADWEICKKLSKNPP